MNKHLTWHKVPRPLHFLCIVAAAACWSFGGTHRQIVWLDPLLISDEHDFLYFRLLETSGGNWYIKLG